MLKSARANYLQLQLHELADLLVLLENLGGVVLDERGVRLLGRVELCHHLVVPLVERIRTLFQR